MKIPISRPCFGPEELQAVQKPLETGWVVQGPFVKQFEESFASFTRSRCAAAASSCTTALHLAVAALGLKPGDEVIVPAFTWIATANAVEYMGAKPIFCDIDLNTYNIDIRQIESHITPRTVGIIPVHLFGLSADMGPIMEIARKRRLWVVEDAACSLGGWYFGKHTGTFGALGCFSFHPRKSITTGEGGMVVTEREELDQRVRSLRDHGSSASGHQRHQSHSGFLLSEYNHLGYNFRMTDIQAAVGVAQMEKASRILDGKTKLAQVYDQALRSLDWLRYPNVPEGYVHGYQSYVILFEPNVLSLATLESQRERRNKLMSYLESQGITTRQGTHAAALQGYYVRKYGIRQQDCPNAALAEALTIALPLFPQMTETEQQFVVENIIMGYSSLRG